MTFPLFNIVQIEEKPREFTFWTVDTSSAFTFTMTLKGTLGESIFIDWGDGSKGYHIFTGSDQIITHGYAVGVFQQRWAVNKLVISKIVAVSQNLAGTLPIELQGFYSLIYFDCNSNGFTGDLNGWSVELEKWANIQYFYIHSNSFTGDLSSWSALSTWINISHFRIHSNSFTGDLSSWSALSTWVNLTTFYIHSNSFTGDLSSWSALSTWVNLTIFYIHYNSFTGDLSEWSALSTWTNIMIFYIHRNSFTGDLSEWSALSTWSSIGYFDISQNSFTGDLSSWSALNTWINIVVFYLYNNNFIGLNNFVVSIFTNRAVYIALTKSVKVQTNSESLTGIYQQPDLGTYTDDINDLTEVEIENLSVGTDYNGLGANIVWSILEQVWILEILEVSSVDNTLRYNFEFTY